MLTPYSTWPAGETKQDLITRMAARLDRLPGFEIAFSQPIMDSVLDYVFDPHSRSRSRCSATISTNCAASATTSSAS